MTSLKVVLLPLPPSAFGIKAGRGGHCPTEFRCDSGILPPVAGTGHSLCFLDSNVPEIEPLAFFGQDSLKSGYFAGRIFMMQAGEHARRILLMKLMSKGRVASRQQEYREVGFREYMTTYYPDCEVVELSLQLDGEDGYESRIRAFLMNIRRPALHHVLFPCLHFG